MPHRPAAEAGRSEPSRVGCWGAHLVPPAGSASGRAEAVPAVNRGSQRELSVGVKQSEGPRGNGEGFEIGKQGLRVQEGG